MIDSGTAFDVLRGVYDAIWNEMKEKINSTDHKVRGHLIKLEDDMINHTVTVSKLELTLLPLADKSYLQYASAQ